MAELKLKIPAAKKAVHGWPSEEAPGDPGTCASRVNNFNTSQDFFNIPSITPYVGLLEATENPHGAVSFLPLLWTHISGSSIIVLPVTSAHSYYPSNNAGHSMRGPGEKQLNSSVRFYHRRCKCSFNCLNSLIQFNLKITE